MMNDNFNAFMNENVKLSPFQSGLLNFYTFAIKDVFSIQNYTNSAGNPDWLRTHEPANHNATVIDKLLNNGAALHGTTHTDELMYSLNGQNAHYGTPVNPKAPDCIPGGSSSGSAVAVAAHLADFAIGTDTGGSVRIPSSYCGIYGFRPTHGAVSMEGCIPLAKSFDTVGWMANDAETLQLIGECLLENDCDDDDFQKLYYPIEAWGLLDDIVRSAFSPLLPSLEEKFEDVQWLTISNQGLYEWAEAFRIIQGTEIWEEHGKWIDQVTPVFGPGIVQRFQTASTMKKSDAKRCKEVQTRARSFLSKLLDDDGLIVIPTANQAAPSLSASAEEMEENRAKNMQLTCIAGLAGLPQITLPLATINHKPIGLSLIANHGRDKQLLKWTAMFVQNR